MGLCTDQCLFCPVLSWSLSSQACLQLPLLTFRSYLFGWPFPSVCGSFSWRGEFLASNKPLSPFLTIWSASPCLLIGEIRLLTFFVFKSSALVLLFCCFLLVVLRGLRLPFSLLFSRGLVTHWFNNAWLFMIFICLFSLSLWLNLSPAVMVDFILLL